MTIFSLAISICVLSYYDVSSNTPNKCDITLWHMGVMEHLLSQETEMTQRQKSTLEKVEQMIQRVTKNGGSPLVNCGLLNIYSYNLAPDFSSQLMDLTIRESEERSGKPANDPKAANGGADGGGAGPMHDLSDSSQEKDNTLTHDYTDKKETDDKRIYQQTIYEGGTDKDTANDKRDANSDYVDKEPALGTTKGDVNESDATEHGGGQVKTADRNPSDELSYDLSENNNRDDFSVLSDPDKDIGGVRGDEDNNGKDNSDQSNEGTNSRGANDINGENNDKNNNQHSDESDDINTQNDENVNDDKSTDANGDVSKEKGSLDSKLYHYGNGRKTDKYKLLEHGDEDTDDNEDEDCYYRSADEFVCTRKTRHHSNQNDISKITNGNMKRVDENNDKNKDETENDDNNNDNDIKMTQFDEHGQEDEVGNTDTDDRVKNFDEDIRGHKEKTTDTDDRVQNFDEDIRGHKDKTTDTDDRVKNFNEDNRGHKDKTTDTDDNIIRLDDDDLEYKDVHIDTDFKTKIFDKDIQGEKDENSNNGKDDDDDKIDILNQDSRKAKNEHVDDDDDQLKGFNEDGKENPDNKISVTMIPYEEENHETVNDDKNTHEKTRFSDNINVDKKDVQSRDEDALTDNVIGSDDRNVDDKLKKSKANDNTKVPVDKVGIGGKQKIVGDRENDDQEMESPLNSNENDMTENNNGDEIGVTENNNNDGGGSFHGDAASIKNKNNNDGLDKDSEEYSTESLTLKEVSSEDGDKSSHINNVIVTEGNDNSDGVVRFDADDDGDNDEEIKMYDIESHETDSKGDKDIASEPQKITADLESLGSESDNTPNDIDSKSKIDDNNPHMTNTDDGSGQDGMNDESKSVSSFDDHKQSNLLKESDDGREEAIYRSSEEKRDKEDEELSGHHRKYTNTASKITSEGTRFQRGHTLPDKKPTGVNDNNDYSTLDMKQLELMFAQRESEQADKIQRLELMLVKLENRILTQSANEKSDTNALISLENQILKLENELMKLSQNYLELQRNHDSLKSQQRKSYLELEHIKTSPRRQERSALTDNSTSEMMKHQNTRIVELSKMIHHQSATAQMLQSRSKYLEEDNRKLFQVVLNQTALISSIMRKLDELGKEELKTKMQTEDSKAHTDNLKQSQKLQQDTQKDPASLKQAAYEYEFGMDYSVKATPPVQSKDLVSIVLLNFRRSPSVGSPFAMLDLKWRCGGLNSTRLCLFHSLIISNCTPFNDLQWKACKQAPGSLLLGLSDESGLKHGDNVLVHLPSEGQMPGVKHGDTSEESKMRAPLGESPKDNVGRYNNDTDNEVMPTVVSMLYDKKHDPPQRSAELQLDGDHSKDSSDNLFKSEPEEISTVKSTSRDEQSRKDGERDTKPDSLRDFSDLIRNGRTVDNEVQNDEGGRSDIKVAAFNRNEDDNRNNGIMFKSGDSDTFEESKKKDNMKSNIQLDTNNNSHQDLLLQAKHSSAPAGAAATAESPCGHNDQSPECSNDLTQRSKPPSDITAARPELHEPGQLKASNIHKNEDNPNVDGSTPGHDEQTSQMKILDDNENKLRKKAAEEAMKTHEALYRNILYKPIYDNRPKDCYELYKQGQERDGLRQIFVSGMNVYVTVYCDMASGGWTLLLKREDGLVDFYRNYEQYKEGFGAPRGEHHIGNEVIHHLTNQGHYSLKVDLTDWTGTTRHAHYDHFWVDGEEDDFRLHLFGYSGDAGDGLGKHSGMKFSTFDVDNDLLKDEMGGSCAKRFQGAGWYYKCYSSNLLGQYYTGGQIPDKRFDGLAWKPWRGPGYSLKSAVLAVRPVGAE